MHINLTCPINQLGYGVASINILKSLNDLGHDVALWPLSLDTQDQGINQYVEVINKSLKNRETYVKYAPSIRIWHQFDLAQHIGKGIHLGFPFFELDTFSDVEKHNIQSQDKLLVTCEWAKDVVLNNTRINNVDIVPLGVDRNIFNENIVLNGQESQIFSELIEDSKNNKVFINIGKWEIRKGHDVLVDIFNKSFSKKDNVKLWMVCTNPFLDSNGNKEWENLYKNSALGDKIRILPRLTNQQTLAKIMSLADYGIFPSRGEGWNLDAIEVLSCGKEVIATDYSAHSDFLPKNNLIPIKEKEPAYDGIWFHRQGNWASISDTEIDLFVDKSRELYKKEKSICQTSVLTSKKFSWEQSARKIIEIVDLKVFN